MKGVSITQLQLVNHIFEQIRDLEDQKNDLNQMATRLTENPGDIQLVMATDQAPKSHQEPEVNQMGMGPMSSILAQHFGLRPVFGAVVQRPKQPQMEQKSSEIIDEDIPDTVALQIIGLLTAHKNAQIKTLVDKLVEMGFQR